MALEDLERYETDVELKIYKEYRDVVAMFRYVVETERRFYLANNVDVQTRHGEEPSTSSWNLMTDGCGTCIARPAS